MLKLFFLHGSQVLHMNVGAKPYVVGQVPANVVWIVVDDDLVAVPQPAVAESDVRCGYVPGPAVEPEPRRPASTNAPNMAGAKAACEPPMLERVVHMIAGVITAGIVTHPGLAVIDVGTFGWPALSL